MKLTAGEVYDAFEALVSITRRTLDIPQTGKYRLARMKQALEKERGVIADERVKVIMELGEEVFEDPEKTRSVGWRVPEPSEKFGEFTKRWTDIRAQEIEVNVEPLKLMALGDSPKGIEAHEFAALGRLIEE